MRTDLLSCCDVGELMDFTKIEIPPLLKEMIDIHDFNFWISVVCMVFNPLFWNVVARLEYKSHFLSRLFGSPKVGCAFLAVTIFHLMLLRGRRYQLALQSQPVISDCTYILGSPILDWIGLSMIALGVFLAVTSFWALGFYGTYLGDYFGILMDSSVTSFPFNVCSHPMYYGSFIEYLGSAIWYKSPAGLFLSVILLITYRAAIYFEEPFTADIYRKKEIQQRKKKK